VSAATQLDLADLVAGSRLLVVGGTGFLGKVWLSMLLCRFPDVGHVHLVVRPKGAGDDPQERLTRCQERFWADVASSPVFDPLRALHPGPAFEAFLKERITPIPGEVSEPFAGVPDFLRDQLRGQTDALVNAAGVVDFNPPLDDALKVNAFGMQNLVALARDLDPQGQGIPFLHTSTCYVAGDRTGQVDEVDPREFPFPKADVPAARAAKEAGEARNVRERLDPVHWDPENEIAECVDTVDDVRRRAEDAFRQSAFLDEAKRNLTGKGEPARGAALDDALKKVRRRYEERKLVAAGVERARFWGWHNIYTYTKSIGEQILCHAGLPFTIVRPAVIESSIAFPFPAWSEGINTSAPLAFLAYKGPVLYPREDETVLDVIPVDMVAAGMLVALGELLEGAQQAVYQLGSSDTNPFKMDRFIELVGLWKRRHFLDDAKGNPFFNWLMAHNEPFSATAADFERWGPGFVADVADGVSDALRVVGVGPLRAVTAPAGKALSTAAKQARISKKLLDLFVPFMATHNYRFSCANTRAAFSRLPAAQRELVPWVPESIEWRHYILDVHMVALQEHVFPVIEDKIRKEKRAFRRHDDLVAMLDELVERHDLAPALLRTEEQGFSRVSYRQLRERARATAARLLAAGLAERGRVILAAQNHPDWCIAYFGILIAGGIVVPLDPEHAADQVPNIARSSGARHALLDAEARESFAHALQIPIFDLHEATAPGPALGLPHGPIDADDTAAILFTSGTTGAPKGVMLSHRNFTSLLGSLARLFPLKPSDRVLSVLPLHHTFEFTCGLLLPLSRGARIIYLDELNGERLSHGLKQGRVTAMVGVPAVWQLLERRIRSQVKEKGLLAELAVDAGLELNRIMGRKTGLDLGRVFFGSVHQRLGGNIRVLISGGAALPKGTQELFQGLGLHLAEGYGLTETAPVLTVAEGRPGAKPGHVGKPVPGVRIRIQDPDAEGIGEVLARGPNVMQGYYGDEAATRAVLDDEGWLHTGDLGRMDHRGRLIIVGRAKDVVVTASGENIYLDDVEASLGEVAHVKELSLVGLPAPRGGERLALLAVPEEPAQGEGWHEARKKARQALHDAIAKLPRVQRPAVLHLVDADLPRTATRKVKRNEVKGILDKIVAASAVEVGAAQTGERTAGAALRAIAAVARVDPAGITSQTDLAQDLEFDSLMMVELAAALEGLGRAAPNSDDLARCRTVGEVETLLSLPAPRIEKARDVVEETLPIPGLLAGPAKSALSVLQREFYGKGLRTRVIGRSFVPANRQVIVVSNHCSHLDMGLVKFGLGRYGRKVVALAAQDYFFEGNRWLKTYFEQLTNLRPIDRRHGLRRALEQAKAVVREGHTVLLFPEGTRYTDGTIHEFKRLVGKLALQTGLDILPVYLDGTFRILPKGAVLPRGRSVTVHIGPPILNQDVLRLTEGMSPGDAARHTARLAHRAVEQLKAGGVLDCSRLGLREATREEESLEDMVARLFGSLPERYSADRVTKPVSWYFSLGGKDGPRWTVAVDDQRCVISPGRPANGRADCVVKTSCDIIKRIVGEAYVPSPPEFMSGAIKTSDIPLLIEFSKVFDLQGRAK